MALSDFSNNSRSSSAPYVRSSVGRGTDGRFKAGPLGFSWNGLTAMVASLEEEIEEMDRRRLEGSQRLASDMVAYAQANAPWQDRTGQARASLTAVVNDDTERHATRVELGYQVFYGEFLENGTQHARSYAIVRPTVDYFKNQLEAYV